MGILDRLRGREQFAQWNQSDPAFARWWFSQHGEEGAGEIVTPYTVWGISSVNRAVSAIAGTIASLPLRTYERQGEEKIEIPSEFDDPFPGPDGLTPFAWVETLVIHLLLWRRSFLWHEARGDGSAGIAYRPILPDYFIVKRINGKRDFQYHDNLGHEQHVGAETVTFIPGPSFDGIDGQPILWPGKAVFSAAISGDRTTEATLRRGIRLGGLITPGDNEEDIEPADMEAILENLRSTMVGREHAGDIAAINRKLKLQPWTMNNIEAQFTENKQMLLGDHERFFGMPPHLMADTERQTSWGTGVQEQNLGLQRYTLMGWTSRIEQALSRRLPDNQFVEFDYHGLLQGTPAEEIALILQQIDKGLLSLEEGRQILNRPPIQWSETPSSDEITSLIEQVKAGLITHDEARNMIGLPPMQWSDSPDTNELIAQVNAGLITHDEARQAMSLPPMQWSEAPALADVIEQVKAGLMTLDEARDLLNLPEMQWSEGPSTDEIASLIEQVKSGLMTLDEARASLNRPAVEWAEGPSKDEIDSLLAQVAAGVRTHDEAREALKLAPMAWAEGPTKEDVDSMIAQVAAGLMTNEEARELMKRQPIEWAQGPTPEEVTSLLEQVRGGLLTNDEARAKIGLPPVEWPDDMNDKVTQAAELIRVGFDPDDTMRALGLPPIKHIGLPPKTVQTVADAEGIKAGVTPPVPIPGDDVPQPNDQPPAAPTSSPPPATPHQMPNMPSEMPK